MVDVKTISQSEGGGEHQHENSTRNDEQIVFDEDIFRLLLLYFSNLWNQFKIHLNRTLLQAGVHDTLDKLARQSAKHPYLATIFSVGFIIFGIPLLIITIFTLSTIALTFTGIIFIEVNPKGTLISIASVLLFGCLGAALIVFLFFGCLVLASYFGFMHIYDLFNGLQNQSALRNFVSQERFKRN